MNRSQCVNRPKTSCMMLVTLLVSLLVTARLSYGGNRVKVRVPRIVREDLVRQAVDFCRIAYPDVPREVIRKTLAPNLKKEKWDVLQGNINGTFGFKVDMEMTTHAENSLVLSFPSGGPRKALYASRKCPFPGVGEAELTKEETEKKAKAAFQRLIPNEEESKGYKYDAWKGYNFNWEQKLGEDYISIRWIGVKFKRQEGYIWNFNFTNRTIPELDRPVISRKEMKKEIARVYGMKELGPVKVRGGGKQIISPSDQVRDESLKLKVGYSMGRHLLWWEYKEEKGGMAQPDTSVFDAVSGQLIYSNVRNDQGEKVDHYRNRGYYPWDTKEKIIQRLEYLAKRRAVELRHRRRQKEKDKQKKQDAQPETKPGEDGE